MAHRVMKPHGSVSTGDSVVQRKAASFANRPLQGLHDDGEILRVNQHLSVLYGGPKRAGIQPKDAEQFQRPCAPLCRDVPPPAAGVTQSLRLRQVGFAALKCLLRTFALRDIAEIDGESVA